ncbi:MAG: 7,8-didemethyl-8-hydroxy-5-deazariboflavin synthase subunit CofG, partial [Myxococcota bacterium]|nr:7,8-didemethyl-8-hydroxy-5-deazariboflavin synthase subunit CofG [Myxococcota bacterium]
MSHAERIVRDVETQGLPRPDAEWLAARLGDPAVRAPLCEAALARKRRAHGERVTVSPNVFIPLTNLCRDRCAYCTFAKTPDSAEAHTYTLEEVAAVVRGGVATGCIEALFCLGDKPEIAYRAYRDWLHGEGFGSTAAYLEAGCRVAFEGGLLPHTNAGILTAEEMARLRHWNVSMGLMLESTSPRLRGPGMPHRYAP